MPWAVPLAILLGAATLMALDGVIPHEHFIKGREGQTAHKLRRTWLFVFAIVLHNLPEGSVTVSAGQIVDVPLNIGTPTSSVNAAIWWPESTSVHNDVDLTLLRARTAQAQTRAHRPTASSRKYARPARSAPERGRCVCAGLM